MVSPRTYLSMAIAIVSFGSLADAGYLDDVRMRAVRGDARAQEILSYLKDSGRAGANDSYEVRRARRGEAGERYEPSRPRRYYENERREPSRPIRYEERRYEPSRSGHDQLMSGHRNYERLESGYRDYKEATHWSRKVSKGAKVLFKPVKFTFKASKKAVSKLTLGWWMPMP